jgi:(p)ppGpp synthase/HD superfamily hydrolase
MMKKLEELDPISERLEKAVLVAKVAHCGQRYGSELHHIHHIFDTVFTAARMELSDKVQCACALHDTLEDTNVDYSLLQGKFGEEIANLVYLVTDEFGKNRKERKNRTYHKIRTNDDAILVKLCDRIANLYYSINTGNLKKLEMYVFEDKRFRNELKDQRVNPNPISEGLKSAWKEYEQKIDNAKNLL